MKYSVHALHPSYLTVYFILTVDIVDNWFWHLVFYNGFNKRYLHVLFFLFCLTLLCISYLCQLTVISLSVYLTPVYCFRVLSLRIAMIVKTCFVPSCFNSSEHSMKKLFIMVPIKEDIRLKWCVAVSRPYTKTKHLYCCEDHFDVSEIWFLVISFT